MSDKHNQEWADRLMGRGCSIYEDKSAKQPTFTIIIPTDNCKDDLEKIFALILDYPKDNTKRRQESRKTNMEENHHEPCN